MSEPRVLVRCAAAVAQEFADGLVASAPRGSAWGPLPAATPATGVKYKVARKEATATAASVVFTHPDAPKQTDSYECRIAVFAVAFHLTAGIGLLPARINRTLWR